MTQPSIPSGYSQKLSFTFDGTGTDRLTTIGGTFVRLHATTSNCTVKGFVDNQEIGNIQNVQQGIIWMPRDRAGNPVFCDKFEITSASAQTIQYSVGTGEIRDDSSSGNVTVTSVAKATSAGVAKVTVGSASGAIIAADTTRRRARVRNFSSTETIFVNGSAAATTNDYPVGPGEEYVHEATTALNGIRAGSVDVDVRVITEKD